MDKFIIYINANKEINNYQITVLPDNEEVYFKSFCVNKSRVLTFKHTRIIAEFQDQQSADDFLKSRNDADFQTYYDLIDNEFATIKAHIPQKVSALTFCFTGFKKADKEKLIKFANDALLRVTESVSLKTDFLAACQHSKTIGQSKLKKAKQYGAKVIYEDQFFHMLDTGEIPE